MGVLTALYFCGLVLKIESVNSQEKEQLGWLLIGLLATVFAAGCYVIYMQGTLFVKSAKRWYHNNFNIKFEGRILPGKDVECIATFP